MTLLDWLLWALVALCAFAWVAAAILVYKALRKPYILALVERAGIGVLTAAASTIIAFLVGNSYQHWVHFESPWNVALIAIALFLLEIPAAIWLVLYGFVWRDRTGDE